MASSCVWPSPCEDRSSGKNHFRAKPRREVYQIQGHSDKNLVVFLKMKLEIANSYELQEGVVWKRILYRVKRRRQWLRNCHINSWKIHFCTGNWSQNPAEAVSNFEISTVNPSHVQVDLPARPSFTEMPVRNSRTEHIEKSSKRLDSGFGREKVWLTNFFAWLTNLFNVH